MKILYKVKTYLTINNISKSIKIKYFSEKVKENQSKQREILNMNKNNIDITTDITTNTNKTVLNKANTQNPFLSKLNLNISYIPKKENIITSLIKHIKSDKKSLFKYINQILIYPSSSSADSSRMDKENLNILIEFINKNLYDIKNSFSSKEILIYINDLLLYEEEYFYLNNEFLHCLINVLILKKKIDKAYFIIVSNIIINKKPNFNTILSFISCLSKEINLYQHRKNLKKVENQERLNSLKSMLEFLLRYSKKNSKNENILRSISEKLG